MSLLKCCKNPFKACVLVQLMESFPQAWLTVCFGIEKKESEWKLTPCFTNFFYFNATVYYSSHGDEKLGKLIACDSRYAEPGDKLNILNNIVQLVIWSKHENSRCQNTLSFKTGVNRIKFFCCCAALFFLNVLCFLSQLFILLLK